MKYLISIFFVFSFAVCASAQQTMTKIPKTCNEAVEILLTEISEENLAEIRKTAEDDLILYHHGLGTTIRNEFHLWKGNLALMIDCGNTDPNNQDIWHPDSISMIIIEQLWKHLNTKP